MRAMTCRFANLSGLADVRVMRWLSCVGSTLGSGVGGWFTLAGGILDSCSLCWINLSSVFGLVVDSRRTA